MVLSVHIVYNHVHLIKLILNNFFIKNFELCRKINEIIYIQIKNVLLFIQCDRKAVLFHVFSSVFHAKAWSAKYKKHLYSA